MNENLTSDPIQVFNLFFKFLFYSISTATLCGSDNALPVDWYNHLFAGTQMLLSFCYFASILGMALSPRPPAAKPKQREPKLLPRGYRTPNSTETGDPPSRLRFCVPVSSNSTETNTPVETFDNMSHEQYQENHSEIHNLFLHHHHHQQQQQQLRERQSLVHVEEDFLSPTQQCQDAHNVLVHINEENSQIQHAKPYKHNHKQDNLTHNHFKKQQQHHHIEQTQQQQQQVQQQKYQRTQQNHSPWTQFDHRIKTFSPVERNCSIQQVDGRFVNSYDDDGNVNENDDEPLLTDGIEVLAATS
ncbi:hypothetical protein ElyMa_003117500 [Elysia marginata]|uniref:Uncharacterized protein n=1 Tax=Elysia marginata TaxID=1093978 RepID=A0AAV4IQQ9_9GAST|nr:hypothetical protein ElyMa_003117500 [Elysia marginata]